MSTKNLFCLHVLPFFSDARSSVTKEGVFVFLSLFPPAHNSFAQALQQFAGWLNNFFHKDQALFWVSFEGTISCFFSFLADKNGHPPPVNPLQFQMLFTLSAKYFSPFEQSTFALSVSQPIFVTLSKDTPCVGETFQTAFSNKFTPEGRKGGKCDVRCI